MKKTEEHLFPEFMSPERGILPSEDILSGLADFFRVFGDATRIKILCALSASPLRVADIASLLGMSQSAISHQLRVLRQARLVRIRRSGRSSIYGLDDDHVRTVFEQGFRHVSHTAAYREGGDDGE